MQDDLLQAIGSRIKEALGARSAEVFAAESKGAFKKSTLRNWINGKTFPSVDDLVKLADITGKDISFFLPVERGSAFETLPVQKLDIRAAAGGGGVNHLAGVEKTLDFPLWMARKLSPNVSRLRLLRALGDSMEPTIRNGALLLVDESDLKLRYPPPKAKTPWDHPDIYVFSQGEEIRLKRLRRNKHSGLVLVLSDNPAYDPEIMREQDLKIEGRVVWWDNKL